MTTIEVTLITPCKFILSCKNHTRHDVCIAVSALVNAVAQYATELKSVDKCTIAKFIYEYGNVELEVDFEKQYCFSKFVQGIDAILTGFELYQENFKDEVKFIKNHLPRGDI